MGIKVFLSYSSLDKDLARDVKRQLERFGMSVFLAHEDVEPSLEWQDVILEELNACDVFMPILTDDFNSSHWTDQESGIAFQREAIILSLKVSVDPHGFIKRYQALPMNAKNIETTCKRVLHILSRNPIAGEAAKDGFIAAFGESSSWSSAATNATILVSLEPFGQQQVVRIVRLMTENDEIYNSFRACYVLKPFVLRHKSELSEESLDECLELLRA